MKKINLIIIITIIVFMFIGVGAFASIQSDDNSTEAIENLKNSSLYGTMRSIEPDEIEKQYNRAAYEDELYHYSVNDDGSIFSMVRLDSVRIIDNKNMLSQNEAIILATDNARRIFPNYDDYNFNIEAINSDGYPHWIIHHKLKDKNGISFGGIETAIYQSEICYVTSELNHEKLKELTLYERNIIDKNIVMESAFNEVQKWIVVKENEPLTEIIEPKGQKDEIIISDMGEKVILDSEKITQPKYDITNYFAETNKYYDSKLDKICYAVKIHGIKRIVETSDLQIDCSFLIVVNAETGEIVLFAPSRNGL